MQILLWSSEPSMIHHVNQLAGFEQAPVASWVWLLFKGKDKKEAIQVKDDYLV